MYNTQLYEIEKMGADGYVERRLLERRAAKLDAEVRERDQLDSQIQTCVASLFERMNMLERRNKQLNERLVSMGFLETGQPEVIYPRPKW